ncbi:MAG: glycosyltransferase [Gammaproteobacteria bacterium]|nr:glycosyltransferase [Gammaproteobacteria bacterium]
MSKKILVIVPRFPYPVIGGDKLRIYQLCKVLASRYRLTLLSLCESQEEMDIAIPDDGVFAQVERVLVPKWQSYLNTLLALPTQTPLQVAYYRSRAFATAIQHLLPHHDGVLAHLIRTGDYVRSIDKPKILEMTDAISLNYGRVKQLKNAGGLKGMIYRLEADRLLAYERAVVDDFDLSVLVSPTDKEFLFGQQARENVLVCSNGVDLAGLPYSPPVIASKVIVFIGNMRTVQNLDACHYFCEDVLPLLRQRGDYRFRIVGAMSSELAEQFRHYDGVEVTGRVESIAAVVTDAAIGVCPMRIGAGVQNKVLEYMALGLPTVTTTLGYEGIHAQPGKDLLIADSPQEFVQQIETLTSNSDDAVTMAQHARQFVEETHEWSAMLQPLMHKIQTLI